MLNTITFKTTSTSQKLHDMVHYNHDLITLINTKNTICKCVFSNAQGVNETFDSLI